MTTCTAEVIERATGGAVKAKTLNNWTERGLWYLPLPPFERGKPRLYGRDHVIEAVLADKLMEVGMPRDRAKQFIKLRCVAVACEKGGGAWESDAIAAFSSLPEFGLDDAEAYWIIAAAIDPETGDFGQAGVIALRGAEKLGTRLAEIRDVACIVLNVSEVIRRVDAAITEAGAN